MSCRLVSLILALCSGILCTVAAGCGPSARPERVRVGLVTKTESNPFFVALRQAAKAEADARGLELVALAGKFDGDNEGQVTAIENLIVKGVRGILVTPSSSTGILTALREARERGILV